MESQEWSYFSMDRDVMDASRSAILQKTSNSLWDNMITIYLYFWIQSCWQIVLSFSLVLHKVSDGRWIKWDTAVVQVISQMQQVWRMLLIDHCVHIESRNNRMDSYCMSICIQTQKWVIYQPSTNGWLNCWILCCFVQTNIYTKEKHLKKQINYKNHLKPQDHRVSVSCNNIWLKNSPVL